MRALTGSRSLRSVAGGQDAGTLADRFERAIATLDAVTVVDPTVGVAATPGWSVGDVFAHLAIESDRYAREVEGHGSWSTTAADIATTNRRELDGFDDRDPRLLITMIRRNVDRYLAALKERHLDEVGHGLDGGLVLAFGHGAGVLLGELVVHGHDVSAVAGRTATIRPEDAAFIVDGAWRALPAFVETSRAAGFSGGFEVRLRGYHTLRVRIDDGLVSFGAGDGRPDVVISADPVAFLLTMYGRRSQFQAVVRLQMVAWGRRPHRAFMLRRLFLQP